LVVECITGVSAYSVMFFFWVDPHPGNLLVTQDGVLCLLDFGLCVEVDDKSRVAMTKAIVHLLSRDFDSLVSEDAKDLGFLPEDFDTSELKPLLIKVITGGLIESGSDLRKRKRKLMDISNELNEIFFRYPFQVPPFFALVTRGLGLLEGTFCMCGLGMVWSCLCVFFFCSSADGCLLPSGIALTGDPDFDIFRASAPYATKRAVAILGSHNFTRMKSLHRKLTRTPEV
jgi:predicted unusual protein kinase regulating ubiquinone biosynthesis (AarF/ABC1/UbiB family)